MAAVEDGHSGLRLPEPLKALLGDPRFWSDFFFQTEPRDDARYSALEDARVRFEVGEDWALELKLNGTSYFQLDLVGPKGEAQLAWDDQAHWHPHVLRWEELDIICRAVASSEPAGYPGISVLLLQRFAPICSDDDARLAFALLQPAWQRLGLHSGRQLHRLVEASDRRGAGFVWSHQEGRWTLSQNELHDMALYTLRCAENLEFPWAQLAQLVRAAETTVQRRGGPAAVNRVAVPPAPRVRQQARISVPLQLEGKVLLPGSGGHFFDTRVEDALRDFGLGEKTGGMMSSGGGDETSGADFLFEDPERACQLAEAALLWARAPADTRLRTGELERVLSDFRPREPPLHLRLRRVRPSQMHFGGYIIHYDAESLPGARAAVDRLLSGASDADENGFRHLAFPDGGSIQACATGEPDQPDGLACIVESLSRDVALFLLEASASEQLVLFPMMLTSAGEQAAALRHLWPGTELVTDAGELLSILERGPRAWWDSHGPALLRESPERGAPAELPLRKWWQFWL